MNREIKFRAFGYENKEMIEVGSLQFFKDGTYIINDELPSEFQGKKLWEILQFTGLHDKNGTEIYGGYILCNDTFRTWEWRGVVKFSHGVFGVEWLANEKSQSMVGSFGQKHNLRRLDDDIIERQVVIGNIFENPELLNP